MKFAVLLLIILCMSGCGENSKITEVIRASLIDPDSAKFGKISINENRACVNVNSKNTLGGYTGNQIAHMQKYHNEWKVLLISDSLSYEECIEIMKKVSESK
ncbi:MAG: hypothetical protein V9G21_04380 [Methylotenera sp.]|nr:hypothetical protein [Methylotenera sp.]HPH08252.1 hypothetical protein [Methylotenera sp.]HPM50370.1 hypothetical protein [Methylotenera sp.]